MSFHVSKCQLLHAETCPFVVRKGSFYKLTAWRKIARCAVYAVLIPYKHSRSRPYYVFRSSVQPLSSVVCCRSKCTRISRWRMPKNVSAKTHHSSHSCLLRWLSACYDVMSCLPDSSPSGSSAVGVTSCSFNSSHRNGLSIRMLCVCVTSDEFLPKIFLRCFVVDLSWILWFFRNFVEIVSLRYVINVIRWCLVNQASTKLRKNQFGWLQAGFFLLYVYSGLPLCTAAAPIII